MQIALALLSGPADIAVSACHAPGRSPNNALLVALLLKHSNVAEELIRAGVNVQVENSEGKTPWSLASASESKKVMKLLKEAGVEPPTTFFRLWL